MKSFLQILALSTALVSSLAQAAPKTEWKSAFTDTEKDCVVQSSSNDQSDIDFFEATCKAFDGYKLTIGGGDIRYNPELSYKDTQIDLKTPGAFHDIEGTQIEWIYKLTTQLDGQGKIEWKGLIYTLSVSNPEGDGSRNEIFAVRLDGEKSCVLEITSSMEGARKAIKNEKATCL